MRLRNSIYNVVYYVVIHSYLHTQDEKEYAFTLLLLSDAFFKCNPINSKFICMTHIVDTFVTAAQAILAACDNCLHSF